MEALGFDGCKIMWDSEYSDSEFGAVELEASDESRDELSTPADTAESQSQADGWGMCNQGPNGAKEKK